MGKIIVKETASKPQENGGVGLEKTMSDKKDELVAVPIDQEVAEDSNEGITGNSELAKNAKIIDTPKDTEQPDQKVDKKEKVKTKKATKPSQNIVVASEDQAAKSELVPMKVLEITEVEDSKKVAEAEKISDMADVLAGDVGNKDKKDNVKESVQAKGVKASQASNVPKAQIVGGKSGMKSMSGMAMDMTVRPSTAKIDSKKDEIADDDLDAMLDSKNKVRTAKKAVESGEPRFSKPKATLIAVAVALIVGVIGGVMVWLMGRSETRYCTVLFESNGGTEIASQEVVCGRTVSRPDDPTKEGFEFEGWVYSGAPFVFDSTSINNDMILVAKWQAKEDTEIVTVTFDTDGGSTIDVLEVAKGKITSAPIAPTKDGYVFVGWQKDGETFEFPAIIDEDITLVAKWEKVQTPVNNNGGSSNGNTGGNNSATTEKKATGLAVSDNEMERGRSIDIAVTVTPSGARVELEVKSSNPSIAQCAVAGERLSCSAMSAGTTRITVSDKISGKTAQFSLTVKDSAPVTIPVTKITVTCDNAALEVGDGTTCRASVSPANATDSNVSWSSSDTSVVTVNANGSVIAVGVGTATITAMAGGKTESVTITVSAKPVVVPPDPSEEEKCINNGGTWENGACTLNPDDGGEG